MDVLNAGLRSPFAKPMRSPFAPGARTPTQRAIAVLRKFGTDAHIYLPGVGMLNGLQAGNYIESTGVTPGAVDQPAGLVLDAAGGLGVELVTNPSFDTPAAWATQAGWSVTGGNLVASSVAQFSNVQQSKTLVQGKTYVVSLTCTSTTGGVYYIVRPDTTNGPNWTGVGTNQFIYTHGAGSSNLYVATQTASFSATFSEISVREVTGTHAQQPTTSAKPILRRGAVNLLTYSGDFSNAAWRKLNGISVVGAVPGPNGALATRIQTDVNPASHLSAPIANLVIGQIYTAAVTLRSDAATLWHLQNTDSAFSLRSTSVVPITTDYVTHVLTFTAAATAERIGLGGNTSGSFPTPVSSQIDVHAIGIFQGTYTAAQIQALGGIPLTTTAPASTALGPYYWQFDGTNDSLSLGGPLFQMADDHCVIAGGMYSGNNSHNNVVASPSQGAAITNRAGQVSYDDNNDSLQSSWYDGVNYDKLEFSYPKETGFVVTAAKRGSLVIQRVGGVQRGTTSATVAFVSDRGSIGAYSGGQNQFNGSIYPVIAIKGTVSDSDLLLLEKWVGSMAGVTI